MSINAEGSSSAERERVTRIPLERLKKKIFQTAKTFRTALPTTHESSNFQVKDSTERPRFGDLSRYRVVDEDEKRLWEIEATRLIHSLDKPQEPINFGPEFTSTINNQGFSMLERLSDQLLCALSICGLDDNLMSKPDSQMGILTGGTIIGRSFDRLETRVGSAPKIIRMGGLDQEYFSRRHPLRRQSIIDTFEIDGRNGKTAEPYALSDEVVAVSDKEAPVYYLLVDYITETLARLLCVGLFPETKLRWPGIVVTALAKFSTKLKVLSSDIPTFGVEVLERYRSIRGDLEAQNGYSFAGVENPSEIAIELGYGDEGRFPNPDRTTGPEDRYLTTYSSDMTTISNWLFRIMWHILKDLNTRNTRNRQTDEFEISAVVFPTGSRSIPTMTFQNRRGHISGSSSAVAVGMSRRCMNLLSHGASQIIEKSEQELKLRTGQSTLYISTGTSGLEQCVKLISMADLLSVMIILSCMEPCTTDDMVKVCHSVRVSYILPGVYEEAQDYTAFASLYNTLDPPLVRRSLPLSDYPESNSGSQLSDQPRQTEEATWKYSFEPIRALDRQFSASTRRRIFDSADKWAIEELAVSVSCLPYTLSIMSGCAILVLGGLMAGFLVGERIDGVDPFNLTMFAWIIAGFIILVSKSIRVGEWTWRDFLRGRVTCRTVHELANATKLSDQDIIMHLLSSEKKNALLFRGPYNNAFTNNGTEGFSVDVMPTVGTLFASGLVVLEVLLESGPALVCFDLRPQAITSEDYDGSSREEFNMEGNGPSRHRMVHLQRKAFRVLSCKDPPLDDRQEGILFRQQPLRWEKILGVYNDPEQKVR